jgi:hypothetical protein
MMTNVLSLPDIPLQTMQTSKNSVEHQVIGIRIVKYQTRRDISSIVRQMICPPMIKFK